MGSTATATVLIDNTATGELLGEWGLSILVQGPYGSVLLDFGQSDAFARNARALGIDLSMIDVAVLSHAHYDHANGMKAFFAANDHASLHVSDSCEQDCWSAKGDTCEAHYIGIAEGLLDQYEHRLVRHPHDRVSLVIPGVYLVPHQGVRMGEGGATAGMYRKVGSNLAPDDFSHELTMVCDLSDDCIAVFSSCSHAGVRAILHEVASAFPGRHIRAFVGGLHLMHVHEQAVASVADEFTAHGVDAIYCGHCTGDQTITQLAKSLTQKVQPLSSGLVITL